MGQRRHQIARCPRCRLHFEVCLCDRVPTIPLATRVVLVMHKNERYKPTSTGPLAMQSLPNHAWLLHGVEDQPLDLADHASPERRGLILFPSDDAVELTPELLAADPRPVTLVVPDGSWRQASRAARRLPGVERFENVVLPVGPDSRYRLRREPRIGGLATIEAIARALGILEGPEVQAQLEAVFDVMVSRMMNMRKPGSSLEFPDR